MVLVSLCHCLSYKAMFPIGVRFSSSFQRPQPPSLGGWIKGRYYHRITHNIQSLKKLHSQMGNSLTISSIKAKLFNQPLIMHVPSNSLTITTKNFVDLVFKIGKGKTLYGKSAFTKMFCPCFLTPDFSGRNLSLQRLAPQKAAVVKSSSRSRVLINKAYVCLYLLKINIKTDNTSKTIVWPLSDDDRNDGHKIISFICVCVWPATCAHTRVCACPHNMPV